MASFKHTIITDSGRNLMAKVAAGHVLTFTKIRTSSATVEDENLESLEVLPEIKQETSITSVTVAEDYIAKVTGIIENHSLNTGYFIKLIGLYAQNPDGGEILYSVSKAIHPDFMPPFNGISFSRLTVNILTSVANVEDVQLVVNPAALVTIKDVEDLNNDIDEAKEDLIEHGSNKIDDENGVHGIRYYEGVLQYFDDGSWEDIVLPDTSIIDAETPDNVTGLSILAEDKRLIIGWTDPNDKEYSTWKGTKLVRKTGNYPTTITDGTLVADNTIKNQYSVHGFEDINLTNGTTYYYQLFPYSTKGRVNSNTSNRISGTPKEAPIYGVKIDITNSNPETAVVYIDDAEGMAPNAPEWNETGLFADIKPCMLKNGEVQYYLDPQDFTKKALGGTADITTGEDGDVMIEVPKIGYLIQKLGDFLIVKASRSADPIEGFCYYPFSKETEGDMDKIYYPAYLGTILNGGQAEEIVMSLSGKEASIADSKATVLTNLAKNRGENYIPFGFYHLTLLQVLYLLRYKNLNSQLALGMGVVGDLEE